MKQKEHRLARVIKTAEEELRIAAKILEWEIGDIWGHVGVRLPDNKGIAVQLFRRAEGVKKDWLVHFDYSLKKLRGVGTIPREAVIYSEIFKARPDVNAAVHCHASMCIALSLAGKPIDWVHMQSSRFKGGMPIFPRPIYILDESEGAELAKTLGNASTHDDLRPRHRDGGRKYRRGLHQRTLYGAHSENRRYRRPAWLQGPTQESIQTLTGSREKLFRRPRDECLTRPSGTISPTRSRKASVGRAVGRKIISARSQK